MIVEEVAALLKEHPENIRRWIRQGKLKATKESKRYDIPVEEVKRLQNERAYEDYLEVQAQAIGQLLVTNESSYESSLGMLHRFAHMLVNSLDTLGISVDDHSQESYEKRRAYYESSDFTAYHSLINEVEDFIKIGQFNEMLKERLKRDEETKMLMKNEGSIVDKYK